MAKLSTGIHEAIRRRLHLLYDGIVDQGVPDRLAAILTAPDGDPAVLPSRSLVA
jgi:Anti-sigma factor NepR